MHDGLQRKVSQFLTKYFRGIPLNAYDYSVVKKIINYEVKDSTIVADAAMISAEINNWLQIESTTLFARLGNISDELLEKITKNQFKNKTVRASIKTENGYLICSYSSVRYRKDKYEMEKQIERAKQIVENPAKIRN